MSPTSYQTAPPRRKRISQCGDAEFKTRTGFIRCGGTPFKLCPPEKLLWRTVLPARWQSVTTLCEVQRFCGPCGLRTMILYSEMILCRATLIGSDEPSDSERHFAGCLQAAARTCHAAKTGSGLGADLLRGALPRHRGRSARS